MALRNIVQGGDEILKKKCRPVEKFDDRLATLLDDMAETLLNADGLGLAGPQVGMMRRVFIVVEDAAAPAGADDAADGDEETEHEAPPVIREFINPEILEESGEQYGYEGCLSFPSKYGAIRRPAHVKCKAQDRSGNEFTFEADGLMARCICHENNHLDGVTIEELADYYFDPDVPHELDAELYGHDDEAKKTGNNDESTSEIAAGELPAAGPGGDA